MDTPEPNTVWPPAPTLPPPEAEKQKPFKLPLPGWIAATLKEPSLFIVIVSVIHMAIGMFDHQKLLLQLREYELFAASGLIVFGIKNWLKFHPKVR